MAIPALPTHLTLEIVTPDRSVVREQVDEVEIPGAEGYFGVLPGHTPLLAMLKVGELWYRQGSEKSYLSIAFGFAEVLPDRVTILAQLAERPDDIDVARAEAAKHRAEERIAKLSADVDFERARVALMKSLVRLQVATRARTRA
jgi:F-type H+-transporting ATPase subunit epsilon